MNLDYLVVFFKHKTAYEMLISYGSSDVCSSDLLDHHDRVHEVTRHQLLHQQLFFDVDHQGFFFAAIDNGGDAAITTQFTRGTLASPFTRLGRQHQLVAHHFSPQQISTSAPPPGMTMDRSPGESGTAAGREKRV